MSKVNIGLEIEKLLIYGRENGLLGKWDIVSVRNSIMDLLQVKEPYEGEIDYVPSTSPQEILDNILDYAFDRGILEKNTVTYRDLFDTKIMGLMMPRESEVANRFWKMAEEESIRRATDDYYSLSKASNYIRTDRIDKNMYWKSETEYGDLEITINLSKPEKDPEAIAAARKAGESNYPKCYLCLENVGYQGRLDHPARQNHRVIPLQLEGKEWFLQYSPYVYYNEHSIVFAKEHRPMRIDKDTFATLIDFIDQIPHYFLGSNADLPLVGGSILSHDHFQGGHHTFPMEIAEIEEEYSHPDFSEVSIGIVKWPMSVIRISSKDKERLVESAELIHRSWREYSDLDREIRAYSNKDGERVPHNTITPIARKKGKFFELDLVLRNNRISEEYPNGIFHPHQELHHIKKENIGLIEVMGLAVLPGRLKFELAEIERYLTGELDYDRDEVSNQEGLAKHVDWIRELIDKYGNSLNKEEAQDKLQQEVGIKFMKVLADAGVYKRDEDGKEGFKKFLRGLGIK